MEASGRWAFAFPRINRLKFVALLRGGQWILVPGCAPHWMNEGDVCLLGRTAYAIASHPEETPVDGQALYADRDVAQIGGDDTIAIGGTVTFSEGSADFLLDMIPAFMIVPRSSPSAGTVRTILGLISGEVDSGRMGTEIMAARLADVLLVEAIRAYVGRVDTTQIGWLSALSDVRIVRALHAIHDDVARPWTVTGLARVAGMSRAAFSAEFTRLVAQPPLTYIRTWRLALAKAAIESGNASVAVIAQNAGYASQGAFGHAFKRAFGASPRRIRDRKNDGHPAK